MRKKSEVGARSNRTFRLSEYEIKCLKEGARNAEMGESEYVRYLIVCEFLKNNADSF